MAYPQQRGPPVRNYGPRPARGGYPPPDGYYDQGYGEYGYDQYGGGYDDAGYGYPAERPAPRPHGPPRGAPRPPRGGYPPMDPRDRGGYGRPPPGYDSRRGYGDRRPPPPRGMRPPGPMSPPRGPPGPRGIERGMAAMDINGRMPDRPHTSNSRRPDMPRQVRSGSQGRERYPPGPARSASAGRPPAPYDRQYSDPYGPPMPISRSATMPVNGNEGMYPGQASYDGGYGAREHTETEDLLDSYYGSAAGDETDMPNFDAIPDSSKDESLPGLETPKPKTTPPSTGQYAAFTPQSAQVHHAQSQPDMRGTEPNQFANAGFQFDLPGEPLSAPAEYQQGGYGFPEDSYGATSPAGGVDPNQNPDALPHHPVPFRPGHDQGSKPAPVRQYNNTPASAQSAAPQAPLPDPTVPKPITHDELHRLSQSAKSRPSDQKLQLEYAQKLVEASVVLVENSPMDTKSKNKAREKYVMDAYKIIKKLVSGGYPDAQFYLADCYGSGQLGLQVDNKEAFSLYHSAAKNGHAQAAYRVAVCCEIGQEEGGGTKRDPFKAVQWYKRAASLGDPPAMYKMGMIMFKGLLGQAKNPREGISWLKRAAERADAENPHALHELALMYGNAGPNDVVVRDEGYASQLFHQAAELGYKFSQFRLGTAYEYGLMGCPVDPRQSIIWYSQAAAQGEHQSELALSGWYLTGAEGILQQSDTEAYLWARKAATSGLAKAEYAMGYFTETGIGVTANLDDAKRWYWRAASQDFPKARERLEELKKGGARMQKTRLSRSAVNQQKQNDGDCVVM